MRIETEVELTRETDSGNTYTETVKVWGEFRVNPADPMDLLEGEYGCADVPWCWLDEGNQQTAKEELWAHFWFWHDGKERMNALDNPPARRVEPSAPSNEAAAMRRRDAFRLIRGGAAGTVAEADRLMAQVNRATALELGWAKTAAEAQEEARQKIQRANEILAERGGLW